MKTVFVNPERCIGCKQCEMACAVEHSQSKSLQQAVLETPTPRKRIHVAPGLYLNSSFPNKCRHCDPAPCRAVCPTGAIWRDGGQGTIVFDGNKCIACAMCAMVCPFDVIVFHPAPALLRERAVALKCDHCPDRVAAGRLPACVEACKVGALEFGEINELVKSAGRRLAVAISVAVGEQPEAAPLPANVQAWRDLGKSISQTGRE
ncbi:MAG TPA: 4Fe-4S dicluster domain-containing protein [Anaerolineae bacterium]|nr:4Fe-4S dicluster domain-containing protein [Anaerolineae bacterium]HOR00651.1 4Fe-4S dicluster domain-containing protein [Anaerolineae bacterium]HPL28588.1 4Fe-4S dicluster domain-containing protein [Anaerolineae bacterium]